MSFFSAEDPTIAIILYVDDFEICNPLGISGNNKVTAVYWVLADVPALLRSQIKSIICCLFSILKYILYSIIFVSIMCEYIPHRILQ